MRKLTSLFIALPILATFPAAIAAPPAAALTITVSTINVVTITTSCTTPDPDGNPNHCDIPINSPIGTTLLTATATELPSGTIASWSLSGDVTATFSLTTTSTGCTVTTKKLLVPNTAYSLILTATGS